MEKTLLKALLPSVAAVFAVVKIDISQLDNGEIGILNKIRDIHREQRGFLFTVKKVSLKNLLCSA